jgi:hypothetical protein
MRFANAQKSGFLMTMLACVLAAASVACGSADGSDHPYMSEGSASTATSEPAADEACTPGDKQACKQYFTAFGTTNCIPGVRVCGEDSHWGPCGQEETDSGAYDPTAAEDSGARTK